MKVSTHIARGDLIRFNLALVPRIRSNYVAFAILSGLAFALFAWVEGFPVESDALAWMLPGSLLAASAGTLGGLVFSFSVMLLNAKEANGILGPHDYEVDQDGLHEETPVNAGTFQWKGIQEVKVVSRFVAFRVAGYSYHIIPRRSFTSRREFKDFVRYSRDLLQQAQR